MTARATQAFANGVKFIGGNAPAYTLEFLTPTSNYPKGAFETIVVPYVELGRENCLINVGHDVLTVSRKHASIERKGKETILKNLSKTNPTLVNGRPVVGQYYLNSGDEIQLSMEGPKIRFNEAKENTPKVALTKRMHIVMHQAVKPYKTALVVIGILILLALVIGAYFIYQIRQENKDILVRVEASDRQYADSLAQLNLLNQDLASKLENKRNQIKQAFRMEAPQQIETPAPKQPAPAKGNAPATIQTVKEEPAKARPNITALASPYIFSVNLIGIKTEWKGKVLYEEQVNDRVCNGFLLKNGLFLTSRHCVDIHTRNASVLNFVANSGGVVTYTFQALSMDEKIKLTFTNHDLRYDDSSDIFEKYTYEGIQGNIRLQNKVEGSDIAYLLTPHTSGLEYDKDSLQNLNDNPALHAVEDQAGAALLEGKVVRAAEQATFPGTDSPLKTKWLFEFNQGFMPASTGSPLLLLKDDRAIAVAMVSGIHHGGQKSHRVISQFSEVDL